MITLIMISKSNNILAQQEIKILEKYNFALKIRFIKNQVILKNIQTKMDCKVPFLQAIKLCKGQISQIQKAFPVFSKLKMQSMTQKPKKIKTIEV